MSRYASDRQEKQQYHDELGKVQCIHQYSCIVLWRFLMFLTRCYLKYPPPAYKQLSILLPIAQYLCIPKLFAQFFFWQTLYDQPKKNVK